MRLILILFLTLTLLLFAPQVAFAAITSASWEAVSDGARIEISHNGGIGNATERYQFEARTFDGETFVSGSLFTEQSFEQARLVAQEDQGWDCILSQQQLEFSRHPGTIGYVRAEEKLGLAQIGEREGYFGAIGSRLSGTETLFASQGSVVGRDLSYQVAAVGKGILEVGLAEWHHQLEGEGEEEELLQSRTQIHLAFEDYEFEGEFHISSPVQAQLETWSSVCEGLTGWKMSGGNNVPVVP